MSASDRETAADDTALVEAASIFYRTAATTTHREALVAHRASALAQGYFGRAVPESCGGIGAPDDPFVEVALREAARTAGFPLRPAGVGQQLIAPTLLATGSDEQQRKHVHAALTGDAIWCMGFSEPGAGSDLAALSTRAERDGDVYRLTGQKIWTSLADQADFMLCMCRTSREDRPQRGVSCFIVDMRSQGVTVRPIAQITGEADYCEVFLDDVRVPASALVGSEGGGWTIAALTLQFERLWFGDELEEEFADLARIIDAADDDGATLELRRIEADLLAHRYSNLRRLERHARGVAAGPIELVAKLHATNVKSAIARLALDVLGEGALAAPHSQGDGGLWTARDMWALAYEIAGGSTHVQRDIIAHRALGLAPR